MAIANTLEQYLRDRHVPYTTLAHHNTFSSFDTCAAAHLSANQLAKAVMLHNSRGDLLMAVIPAANRLSIMGLNNALNQDYKLMDESNLYALFPDCDIGAIPSLGFAYEIPMVVDYSLFAEDDVYIEAGDHHHLLKLDHVEYVELLSHATKADLCGSAIGVPKFTDTVVRDW